MRIISLSAIYPNERFATEGRSVAFLDRALAKLEVQATTLVLKPWIPLWLANRVDRWKHLGVRSRIEEGGGGQVVFSHYLHIPPRYRLDLCVYAMALQTIHLIKKIDCSFDVIHGQSLYPSALAAGLVARRFRVPFVITLRDDLSHLEDRLSKSGPSFAKLVKQMFHHVNGILVHGPAILRDLPRYLPKKRSIPALMAPNGVDVEGIERILSSLPPSQLHPWGSIVSVGYLYRLKGIHENLRALKILDERGLRDWKYTVVGDGPYREELKDLSIKLGLKDRVRFEGRVPFEKAIAYMREADIFSLPSFAESFGNVYAEAAVCGKPVVGCRGYGAEVTVRDGETGILVAPRDVQEQANALVFLLRNPETARAMGQKGREMIREFTWERTARIYKEVMEEVIHPK